MFSSTSVILPYATSVATKLTGEFASLEELTDDSDNAIVLTSLADGSDETRSERQIKPKDPTRKFRLPIVKSMS
jgi:hypothetical protein